MLRLTAAALFDFPRRGAVPVVLSAIVNRILSMGIRAAASRSFSCRSMNLGSSVYSHAFAADFPAAQRSSILRHLFTWWCHANTFGPLNKISAYRHIPRFLSILARGGGGGGGGGRGGGGGGPPPQGHNAKEPWNMSVCRCFIQGAESISMAPPGEQMT